jgi:SAM-dependent methyltransferase
MNDMANRWSAGLTPAAALALRAGFDDDAEVYQRTRPVCPPALFDDLIRLAGLSPGDRVLEIAPGTGQATVPLAERGLAVTAVELGPSLAAVARRRLASFPAVEVVTSSFEDWQPRDDVSYDAVVVCNALHWIDAEVRYAKPAALLRPGSAFAIASCQWARPVRADPFWTEVQQDYLAVGFRGSPPPAPDQVEPWRFPPAGSDAGFVETASRRYPFAMTYSAADYLAQLSTQAGTRELGSARAADFLDRVRRRLDALGSPALTATFVACLTIGTRRERPGSPGWMEP